MGVRDSCATADALCLILPTNSFHVPNWDLWVLPLKYADSWANQKLRVQQCVFVSVWNNHGRIICSILFFSSFQMHHYVQHFLTLVYLVGIWVTPICQAILFLNWGTLSTCNICESDKTLLPCLSFSVLHNQVVHKLIKLICKMKTSLSILHLYFPSLILEMSEEEPSLILLPLFHLYFPHAISWLENLGSNYENAHMVCAAVKGSYWDLC